MKVKIESGFLPKLQQFFYLVGSEFKNISNAYRIIILIIFLSISTTAQSINNETDRPYDGDWLLLGLENESITAIAIDWADSNIIYAGSSSDFSSGNVGGIFKTTNAGTTWDTLIRGVTVCDLDIHPTIPKIIYATLGLNGLTQAGIIKTTDAGYTWVQADSGILITWEEGPLVLEIDPQHPDTLYSGTAGPFGGKPYKSTDGGEGWFRIDPDTTWMWMHTLCGDSILVYGDPMEDGITAIAIDPINTNIIFMGTPWSGYLFKSSDGGISWIATCLPEVGIDYDITLTPQNTETLYCGTTISSEYNIGIFKTTEGGVSWSNPTQGLPDSSAITNVLIYESNDSLKVLITLFSLNNPGIYQSVNGNEWQYYSDFRAQDITKLYGELYASSVYGGIYVKDILTDFGDSNPIPFSVKLHQNYPNPFNPRTVISYQLSVINKVKITVYDLLGKEIAVLVNEVKPAGEYEIKFDGERYGLSSGVYLYVLNAEKFITAKKMIYLK
jgi:hypothetical protein